MSDYMGMGTESGVVDTPIVEAPTTEPITPVATTEPAVAEPVTPTTEPVTAVTAEPKIVEKVIEKIVEKYPEFKDDNAKQLFERFVDGDTDAVYNYLSEIKKNYDTMSSLDVVRQGLAKKNPQWSKDEVELEIRAEYGSQLEKYDLSAIDKELDPEAYKEAVEHNNRADANLLKLERDARDHRHALKEAQKTVELPKIKKEETTVPEPQPLTQEQIDESKRLWVEAATNQVPALADFKFQVGTKEQPEDVVFAITDEDRAARTEAMKSWNGKDFMANRGWTNEDGSFNLLKIAEDVHTLENLPKIIKSIHTQAKNATVKEVVSDIKNVDLSKNQSNAVFAESGDVTGGYWN